MSATPETHAAPTEPEALHEEHHGPTVKMYFAIFFALATLTVVTVLAARFDFAPMMGVQMGGFVNNIVALGIAVTKASLVVLFFMHVKYESKLVGLAVVASVIWLSFLILITLSDYLTRTSDWHLFTR
ncbi:MAG: cytochrome C oxidase subunit IV family protein [Vicinamibacteria bacterium]